MRVTNSMLASNLLRNLHTNYRRSDKLQNKMSTGRRFAHISDDPTALIYSQAARNKMARLDHYQMTIGTAKGWLRQVETSIMEVNEVLTSIYESTVDAASDAKTATDRQNIAQVVAQLRDHYVDTLNSSFGNNYVFGGYNTPGDPINQILKDTGLKPFAIEDGNLMFNSFNISQFDGMPAALLEINLSLFKFNDGPDPLSPLGSEAYDELVAFITNPLPPNPGDPLPHPLPPYGMGFTGAFPGDIAGGIADFEAAMGFTVEDLTMLHRLKGDVLSFDVGPGIEMPVTFNGIDIVLYVSINEHNIPVVRNTYNVLTELYETMMDETKGAADLTKLIKTLQDGQNAMLMKTAEIGGRSRRLDLLDARYEQDQINNRKMLSDAEDIDMAEVIMELRMAEAVMQASMAAGARIIQPTLMDFLR